MHSAPPCRVVVAMSGGVDSSVAAAMLREQGFDVVGVMLRLWSEPPPRMVGDGTLNPANRCCTPEAVNDARAVAARLDIPFYVVDARQLFKEQVVDRFVQDYAGGLTPNPCVQCNRLVRFGFLLSYARSVGARYLATGHYARVNQEDGGSYTLLRGVDRAKDQSYVLSMLGQNTLSQLLFPVGALTKPQVRALAAERGLPTASRHESQDLCFVSDGDYRRFLADHVPEALRPGPITDRTGSMLGTHRGLPFYTIGQRSGLGIGAPWPLYVLELDPLRNALVVGTSAELGGVALRAGPVNWITGDTPGGSFEAEVQIRYHAVPATARVSPVAGGYVEATFEHPVHGIAPGQAAVFYRGDRCLGGGPITAALQQQGNGEN